MRFELRVRLLAGDVVSGRMSREKAIKKIIAHKPPRRRSRNRQRLLLAKLAKWKAKTKTKTI